MKTTALVTTLLLGCLAATAQATTTRTATTEVRQAVVNYADLNLESEAGAQTLLRRIKFAARRVCGVNDIGVLAIEFRAQLHRCAEQATARAVADVDGRAIVVANAR